MNYSGCYGVREMTLENNYLFNSYVKNKTFFNFTRGVKNCR